jgi:hypothetical protein
MTDLMPELGQGRSYLAKRKERSLSVLRNRNTVTRCSVREVAMSSHDTVPELYGMVAHCLTAAASEQTPHYYVSTACFHGQHLACVGAEHRCAYCNNQCRCVCHKEHHGEVSQG